MDQKCTTQWILQVFLWKTCGEVPCLYTALWTTTTTPIVDAQGKGRPEGRPESDTPIVVDEVWITISAYHAARLNYAS